MHGMHLDEHDEEGYEEVDINTPSAGYLLAMRGDDGSSDWNSDFSSPSSRHRSEDQPTTETMTIDPSASTRLQDRARGRGVLEAQQKIREQERCLRKINELRDMFLEIRPGIMRLLALELPDRGLQVGTLAFASATRDVMGSSEISVEEEELWELWREMEALLAVMDNENGMRPQVGESPISLRKKRAIMMAFCDWEQYSQYVQDAWARALEGIAQPYAANISRHSSTSTGLNRSKRSSASSVANNNSASPANSSGSSNWTTSRGITTGSSVSMRRRVQPRRRSVIGVAPESLHRIISEAERIKNMCVFHLGKMSQSWIEFMRRVELELETDEPLATGGEVEDGSEGDDEEDSVPSLSRQQMQQATSGQPILGSSGPGAYGSVAV
ncbi:hypothetical protein FBU59_002382 [Linderina macrospora]|uniref:Uncharacterized protein n=1 Tax=Linderina macrospora TaxID=4868 RepID=A0ACC1JB98_9FUNG|nr:hypothetical protein FBU59_002382 [Linderina macrospora]